MIEHAEWWAVGVAERLLLLVVVGKFVFRFIDFIWDEWVPHILWGKGKSNKS